MYTSRRFSVVGTGVCTYQRSTEVGVAVGGMVGVGSGVKQGGCVKASCKPELMLEAVLHSNCVFCGPVPFCTPTVAPAPPSSTWPYTKSIRLWFSYNRTSKLAIWALLLK